MTLSRTVAVYETGFIVYAVIGVVMTVLLYLWALNVIESSNFLRRMHSRSTYLRVLMRIVMLSLMSAIGMGWPAGIVAWLLAKVVLARIHKEREISVRDDLTPEQCRVLDIMNSGDVGMTLVTFVQNAIQEEGEVRTRRILELVLEHWGAFTDADSAAVTASLVKTED